jgi:hypothetical protein
MAEADLKDQIHNVGELVKLVITKLETRIKLVDEFDDRLVRAESLEKSLAAVAFKLAAAKALTSWVPGALAGAVAGATAALLLASCIAGAR